MKFKIGDLVEILDINKPSRNSGPFPDYIKNQHKVGIIVGVDCRKYRDCNDDFKDKILYEVTFQGLPKDDNRNSFVEENNLTISFIGYIKKVLGENHENNG